jgi:hypothetical protein
MNTIPLGLSLVLSLTLVSALSGCSGATTTESAARTGALIGALDDGWAGAATGAILGGAFGAAVDNAENKKEREARKQREQSYNEQLRRKEEARLAAIQSSSITADPKTAYRPDDTNQLVGRTWRIISFKDDSNSLPEFSSWIITFTTNSKATTMVMWADGRVETFVENYSITADVLVFSGKLNGQPYVTNSRFSLQNGLLTVVTSDTSTVLEEVDGAS